MSSVLTTLKGYARPESLIKNTWLFGVLSLFLAMYGPRLQPELPNELRNLFNNPLFRGLIIFLIIYLSERNMATALVITVVFIITINLLTTSNILENVKKTLMNERYNNYGKPLNTCSLYTEGKVPHYSSNSDDEPLKF